MKVEFETIGDGTNIQVRLIDDFGVRDHIYTADHRGGIHYGEERAIPISAHQLFRWVEESWAPPIIGGKYAHLHPYWYERGEFRLRPYGSWVRHRYSFECRPEFLSGQEEPLWTFVVV
jgi:hypothetical protein